jgi:hypothetical protein
MLLNKDLSSLQIIPVKRDAYVLQFEYSNDETMKYFKQQIDKKIGPMSHKTNVKGEMTNFDAFLKDSVFLNFIESFFLPKIYQYQKLFPQNSTFAEEKKIKVIDAWGNKLEKGNQVIHHNHYPAQWSSTLYFCDSAPLVTEAGEFKTCKGKIITISGWILHGVEPVDKERYCLVWNWNK